MQKMPISMRKHIALLGDVNSGKSTLFNALLGRNLSIISDFGGTTTDPVIKAAELLPYGPVALIDTAGFGDDSVLGEERIKKTKEVLKRTDLIIYVSDINSDDNFDVSKYAIPYIRVFTKCDKSDKQRIDAVLKQNPDCVCLYNADSENIDLLKEKICGELKKQDEECDTLIGDLVESGGTAVFVIPIDEAAPKGRLILPQVQLIRDCLDNDIKVYIANEKTLRPALEDLKQIDLVVTDSQIFKFVSEVVPPQIPLTSFSMLLARQKGNFSQLYEGALQVESLRDGDTVLLLEGCTHNTTHSDIGRVKIPTMLEKKLGKKLNYEYYTGYDFPDDLSGYSLAIQCGSCMLNKKEIKTRLELFEKNLLPVTNYGIILAYLSGVAERASEIFRRNLGNNA